MNLTTIQRRALAVMRKADGPVRGGYSDPISSTTGRSLVGHGLAEWQAGPKGDRRGNFYTLTEAGRRMADEIEARS